MFPYVSSVCLYVSFWNYKFTRVQPSAARHAASGLAVHARLGPILSNRVQKKTSVSVGISPLLQVTPHLCLVSALKWQDRQCSSSTSSLVSWFLVLSYVFSCLVFHFHENVP